ncbi:MAG: hypothetical protein OEY19_10865 [Gammaproteobacteria bacterium]|nr:hypothetical protein [Gammaproteobacteria bacterium]MDH5629040.1 hypothetical protein [Gammaproteobacteria bacterium]
MNIEAVCTEVLSTVPKAIAAGIIDMSSGMLLDVKTTDSHPSQVLDMLAAATKDLFEGDMVMEIEDIFKKTRGESDAKFHYFKEVIVNSTNLIHIFSRIPSNESIIGVVVCRASANLGLCLTKMRSIMEKAEA